jgi:hypothetical protein
VGANEVINIMKELGAVSEDKAVCVKDMTNYIGVSGSLPTPYRKGLVILKKEGNVKTLIKERLIVTNELRKGHNVTVKRVMEVEYYYL